ncbi:MAG: Crp/Fnr family transcriptional regulator [Prolixibacteraceae bacterium]|jgi:CRP/FNR family transcriptional regulator, polysaccharide utilization system transcription regulator|nr:Crp/Fnr family transcriptional regulator [Prolixibacteraceae bacterium]MBT6763140.1 Crp/Fnr family transcriptional regulator [Prolixibacteraceae bacterium]MBT6999242.1 Crp/Fnr family transcriptional regulator [Prolixibacteraceae bacterium]MBT7393275.1 Crp/Fnr family transcriptional regulator [Prolixibacteraceae bacterium]
MKNIYSNTCTVLNNKNLYFDELTEEEMALIESNKITLTYKKGEIISKQGSFASHIIYLKKGLAKVYLEGKSKNLILTITPPGNLMGLPCLYDGNNVFLYSASTYIDSEVELIDIDLFKQLLLQNSKFAFAIIKTLNASTVQTFGRFYCFTHKQMHGRLADILLCLSQRIYGSDSFNLPLSRSDLAELTGMSTESVIRVMKDFKDDGLIKTDGKDIELIDIEMLLKISEVG